MIISSADPNWRSAFLTEKRRIQSIEKLHVTIEHIGSTSIPNMDAKPVIDMLVGTDSEANIESTLKALIRIGYRLEGRRNDGRHSWLSFPAADSRGFIIHLVIKNDDEWHRRIYFRDFLKTHPKTAHEYKVLKADLAKKHPDDLNMYTFGKAEFVINVLATASLRKE